MDWMPGVRRMNGRGRALNGGGKHYANWHSTENDPGATADSLARYLIGMHYEPHFVWNPWTGELIQLLPASVGGSVLKSGNVSGSVNIGIEAIGRAGVVGMRPFLDSPMKGFGPLLDYLRSLGIPDAWPAGPPLPYPQSAGYGNPQRAHWGASGHYGHSQWPSNDHGDPGLINVGHWIGSPVAPPIISTGNGRYERFPEIKLGASDHGAGTSLADVNKPVTSLQLALNIIYRHEAPLDPLRLTPDGDFGPRTDAAVRLLQQQFNRVVDGDVGPDTWTLAAFLLTAGKR